MPQKKLPYMGTRHTNEFEEVVAQSMAKNCRTELIQMNDKAFMLFIIGEKSDVIEVLDIMESWRDKMYKE